MVLFGFAEYSFPCSNIPSLPACNLFFRQALNGPPGYSGPALDVLGFASEQELQQALPDYGVGVDASCYIPRMAAVGGQDGSLGNIANIILCGLSVFVALGLAGAAIRRVAAVGRIEMSIFFVVYALVQGAQLVTTGAILRAGSTELVWVTAAHLGLLVGLFWILVWCAFLSIQLVEDGTLLSLIPMLGFFIVLLVGSGYVFLDTGLNITDFFYSDPFPPLKSIWVFVLTIIWPAAAAAIYFIVQMGVVVVVLREKKPLLLFTMSAFAFALAQGAYFALSHTVCTGTGAKIDGSWIATLLETVSVGLLYGAWQSITEDSWKGEVYME